MKRNWFWRWLILSLIVTLLPAATGCGAPEEAADEPDTPPDSVSSETEDYFYPWISHGTLTLSTGEVIEGPDLFESDMGYIGDFTKDYSFNGKMIWLVEESNALDVEWAELTFNVSDYHYPTTDEKFNIDFTIMMEDFFNNNPAAGPNAQSFELDIVENRQGFEIKITRITFAREQEGHDGELIDYVELQVELRNAK
ncbi:MAG: hypothetical protein AB1767_11655 [Bacillota bacterium]